MVDWRISPPEQESAARFAYIIQRLPAKPRPRARRSGTTPSSTTAKCPSCSTPTTPWAASAWATDPTASVVDPNLTVPRPRQPPHRQLRRLPLRQQLQPHLHHDGPDPPPRRPPRHYPDHTKLATDPGAPSSPRFLRLRWASPQSATAFSTQPAPPLTPATTPTPPPKTGTSPPPQHYSAICRTCIIAGTTALTPVPSQNAVQHQLRQHLRITRIKLLPQRNRQPIRTHAAALRPPFPPAAPARPAKRMIRHQQQIPIPPRLFHKPHRRKIHRELRRRSAPSVSAQNTARSPAAPPISPPSAPCHSPPAAPSPPADHPAPAPSPEPHAAAAYPHTPSSTRADSSQSSSAASSTAKLPTHKLVPHACRCTVFRNPGNTRSAARATGFSRCFHPPCCARQNPKLRAHHHLTPAARAETPPPPPPTAHTHTTAPYHRASCPHRTPRPAPPAIPAAPPAPPSPRTQNQARSSEPSPHAAPL